MPKIIQDPLEWKNQKIKEYRIKATKIAEDIENKGENYALTNLEKRLDQA